MRAILFTLLLLPAICLATTPEDIVAELIARDWAPLPARVEWTFASGQIPALDANTGYTLAGNRSEHPGGQLTLKLVPEGKRERDAIIVNGTAKVFGSSLTVKEYLPVGTAAKRHDFERVELDWTHLNRTPLVELADNQNYIAARGLVPGRVICESDLKPAPVITRSQPVVLEYIDGNIMIALTGTAMADGAVGDIIPVRVELEHNKRYRGEVLDETRVRFTAR